MNSFVWLRIQLTYYKKSNLWKKIKNFLMIYLFKNLLLLGIYFKNCGTSFIMFKEINNK